MTKDGEIVAVHDTLVDRTTDGKGSVGELTLSQIKKLDAGSWFNRAYPEKARPEFAGQKIPTLQEVIDLARNSSAGLYIETKNPELYPASFESKILEIIRLNKFEKRVMIQSFNALSIRKIKKLDASIPTALLIEKIEGDPVDAVQAAGANELAIHFRLLTPEILRKAHEKGLTVAVWTVDEVGDLKKMIDLGVERIITNYPDRLNRILGR
jgi:glycerophosphoryl diester phosphodiesterase